MDMNLASHHLIFGELKETDALNWNKKIEVTLKKLGYELKEYRRGSEKFIEKFEHFFTDPRRFTYTPVNSFKERKALN